MNKVAADMHDDIVYPSSIPFVLLHLAAAGALLTGVTLQSLCLCAALYTIRMLAIGAGYHRYFSHRAFSTSRTFQLVLAILAQSSAQRGVLWWAAKHRHHHLHADTPEDVHSPAQHGFLYAHIGWIFVHRHDTADFTRVGDLARYPELRWLNRVEVAPAVVLAAASYMFAGWSGLVVGFVWSTVLLYHATFAINSLAHTHGRKRYLTGDDSRNNLLLALITFGEGWHNNHHAFQSSARQGFQWWEIDITFYVLRLLAAFRLVWKLKPPPARLLSGEEGKLQAAVLERVALRLAQTYLTEAIIDAARSDYATRCEAERFIASSLASYREGSRPLFPERHDIVARASAMFVQTCHIEQIAERTRALISEALICGLARRQHCDA